MAYTDEEKKKAYFRAYYQRNKPAYRDRCRRQQLKRFGLTPEDFQDVLDEQGGGCAICGRSARVTRMAVDHNHRTGEVRGILCTRCNTALGMFDDDPETLLEAAAYLNRLSSGVTSMMSSAPQSWPWTTLAFRIRHSTDRSP